MPWKVVESKEVVFIGEGLIGKVSVADGATVLRRKARNYTQPQC